MDQLSQALAAGFNAPVVYIQSPERAFGCTCGRPRGAFFPLAVWTYGTSR